MAAVTWEKFKEQWDTIVLVAYLLYFVAIALAAAYEVSWPIVAVGVSHFVFGALSPICHKKGSSAAFAERYLQSWQWSLVAVAADVVFIPLSIVFGSWCVSLDNDCSWQLWAAVATATAGNIACLSERLHKMQPWRKGQSPVINLLLV